MLSLPEAGKNPKKPHHGYRDTFSLLCVDHSAHLSYFHTIFAWQFWTKQNNPKSILLDNKSEDIKNLHDHNGFLCIPSRRKKKSKIFKFPKNAYNFVLLLLTKYFNCVWFCSLYGVITNAEHTQNPSEQTIPNPMFHHFNHYNRIFSGENK